MRLCDIGQRAFQCGEIAVNLGVAPERPRPFVTFGGDVAKTAFAMPAARRVLRDAPQQELHELAKGMATARPTNYGAVNVTTTVLSRSTRSTFIVADDPESYPHQAIDRDEWDRVSALQDAYIADAGDDPGRRLHRRRPRPPRARPPLHRGAATRTSRACRTSSTSTIPRPSRRAGARRDLHAQPGHARLPGRPPHRRRPRPPRHPRLPLRLLRGVEEGRPADVEQARLRARRPRAARRLQGDPDRRAATVSG